MELILLPQTASADTGLKDLYHRALRKSQELYIVSAYLTHWDIDEELGDQCKSFRFIVGKDFGITRKAACEKVIKWLPKRLRAQFLAAESITGFHPKAMFWRETNGKCYALLGSSNLSRAAFSTNHEANGYAQITKEAFGRARSWLSGFEDSCVTLDNAWLANYREAIQPKKPGKSETNREEDHVLDLRLPAASRLEGLDDLLIRRRKKMRLFSKNKAVLEKFFRDSARANTWSARQNLTFYEKLNSLWFFDEENGYRFQGAGWERKGKGSNFNEFSKSLVRVLDADEAGRDQIVVDEIDRLRDAKVSTRGALFSEMLCQFFPRQYHVIDDPVSQWLSQVERTSTTRASEGVRYISAARMLRAALRRQKNYPAKNIAELDTVIWLAVRQRRLPT